MISITFVNGLNSVIKLIETGINQVVVQVNRVISAINRRSPIKIPLIPMLSLPIIPLPELQQSIKPNFENNAFRLGTGIPLTLGGGSTGFNGGSQQVVVNINAGSIIYEKQLFEKVDEYFKSKLKGLGFSGF